MDGFTPSGQLDSHVDLEQPFRWAFPSLRTATSAAGYSLVFPTATGLRRRLALGSHKSGLLELHISRPPVGVSEEFYARLTGPESIGGRIRSELSCITDYLVPVDDPASREAVPGRFGWVAPTPWRCRTVSGASGWHWCECAGLGMAAADHWFFDSPCLASRLRCQLSHRVGID